ncbi:hypothetical protein EXIGLDRAFT_719431 [Exidia glandulosa HHB12029]|uniref:Uncharacterized protein n=2 Tax=Exidia glandulosa HHB12029 TaxID=1314781 RepID=A0A165H2R3_EXIGL|nr:hypothetical protein EXIGLDRAFT_719431 [Exidia glandulosa HHB12029]
MREASTGSKGGAHAKRPSTAARNPLPPSPKFNTAPIRWKGLTYDAARWTLSSEQLQEIVTRAIKHSAESSSIRLLQPDVVEFDLPTEIETLTRQREELRGRLKQQIRTRRLLLRKLTSPNSTEPLTAQGVARNMGEIMDACAMCDQLSEELFHVSDQLAQIVRLRDVHQASALSMALRKINTSFVRVTSEAVELQKRINTLEAEREEAWHTAESVESELNEMRAKLAKQSANCKCDHDADAEDEVYSRPSSRVSAARKTSMRASKASLRLSARKSRASSVASSRMFSPDSSDDVPPVPPMPLATSPLQALTDFHNANAKASQSIGATSFVSSIQSPSPESRALAAAQAELLELLGITMNDITGNRSSNGSGTSGRMRRPRSASDAGMHPPPSAGLLLDAPAQFSPQPSPRWTVAAASPMVDAFGRKLRRSVSEYTSKRITAPRPDSMLLSPPRDGSFPTRQSSRGLLEDPDSLLALMTRAASSTESSPLPGHTFTTGRTYI